MIEMLDLGLSAQQSLILSTYESVAAVTHSKQVSLTKAESLTNLTHMYKPKCLDGGLASHPFSRTTAAGSPCPLPSHGLPSGMSSLLWSTLQI